MPSRVAVVGAGLSGLIAAHRLQDAGHTVVVFDKGRRPGGRANTREHGTYRFDHGAQFFTVRDDRICALLARWLEAGLVAPWQGTLVRVVDGRIKPAKPATRYVGVPGMIDLALNLASTLDVRPGVRVEELERTHEGWRAIVTSGEDHGCFDHAVVAVPAPQAVPLLEAVPSLRDTAADVGMSPCWAVLAVFAEPLSMPFDGAFVADGPISWMARDTSKPGRPSAETWIFHANPEWTQRQWDIPREELPTLLLEDVRDRWGSLPDVVFQRAHRWGYALSDPECRIGSLFDPESGLGVCGDWCVGGRVEGALVSGIDVADRLLDGVELT